MAATTRVNGNVVSNAELDEAIRAVVSGKPDCPAIRRFMQGLRLLGGVVLPGRGHDFQPALRLDVRPLRRLHTLFMLPGWVRLKSLPSTNPAVDSIVRLHGEGLDRGGEGR